MKLFIYSFIILFYFSQNIYAFDIEKFPIFPVGIKYTNPTGPSVTLISPYLSKLFFKRMLFFEPGTNCGKFHIAVFYNSNKGDIPVLDNFIKLSFLHTWKGTTKINKNENYVGAEYTVRFFLPSWTLGVYKNIDSNINKSDTLISTGVGLFF